MCVCATAKRRRKQAKNGYSHLAKQQRPRYRKRDPEAAKRHLQKVIENERRIGKRS